MKKRSGILAILGSAALSCLWCTPAAIAEGTGDLQLSSSERLSPVHETLNDFEHRLASGELPFDARLDSVRRPLFFVRWLSEELTRGINRGDIGWASIPRLIGAAVVGFSIYALMAASLIYTIPLAFLEREALVPATPPAPGQLAVPRRRSD